MKQIYINFPGPINWLIFHFCIDKGTKETISENKYASQQTINIRNKVQWLRKSA